MTYMYATPSASFPLTVSNAINYSETATATPVRTLLPLGCSGVKAVHKRNYVIPTVVGNRQEFFSDPAYTGIGTVTPASPTNRVILYCVAYSPAPWAIALTSSIRIAYKVEFFGRIPLIG